jgi:hypothetical protein
MLVCEDIAGPNWFPGLLVVTGTRRVIIDPRFDVTLVGTTLVGRFRGTGETDFPISCTDLGDGILQISFRRNHPDGLTTTDYSGIVVDFLTRARLGVIEGTFERTTFVEGSENLTLAGDWETERPT